jgi:hypothetical protein
MDTSDDLALIIGTIDKFKTLKNHQAIAYLINTLNNPWDRPREIAIDALKDISKQDFGANQAQWTAWMKTHYETSSLTK